MIRHINNYLSLVKFSHTIFALPFAVIGFFLGTRQPGFHLDLLLLLKVLLCMVFARTSAMAFNRYADRFIDSRNDRTKVRELPSGIISSGSAFLLVVISSAMFMLVTYFINTVCFYLSPVALAVVLGYSYTKRFTWLCHFILGIGLSLAPIGSYLAVTGTFDWLPLLFSFTVICWVSGFDIIYALQDEQFDKANQLHSIPESLGRKKAMQLSSVIHLMAATFIIIAGIFGNFGMIYWAGAIIFTALLIYQHAIIRPDDLSRINVAFFSTNGIASLVFACFVVAELLRK
jgi:4-hydroxybenzoate polyprenyltransferase